MIVTFPDGDPIFRVPGDGDEFDFAFPWRFVVDGEVYTIPAGFRTDLESIPKWLPLMYTWLKGKARIPCLPHDYLYATKGGKKFADSVFLAGMVTMGVNPVIRWIFYNAVKFGGDAAYYGKERHDASNYPVDLGE